jgi:arsenate reductase
MSWTIWHNPRCRKSRETLQLLRDNGVEPEIRLYLQDGPSVTELASVVERLGVEPRGLMRTKETLYKTLGLGEKALSAQSLIEAMAQHSSLIERPVVLVRDTAALGRPPANVLDLLKAD